jgi:hypothetical protein
LIKALEEALAEVEKARRQSETEMATAKTRLAAEELANCDFIKASESSQDFRDHLARFPRGVSEPWALERPAFGSTRILRC